ncbi:endonuclease/exonuclease/phosphatase family protein [Martelella radicis]|uniref:Endonuclease/exonuclease/phosphatase family metal-dependent hydrolase n=1 Tax=Martelella radicis TaxID=1397476 RepID=A0A7W6KMQ3_9HYPH|nr:endonuclease/exonuclease/phosphatase family protein [Martelella radicis]MBB4123975.1 endonuclease/exonuclease/phosphatase family metal-dependent hydrolase [Martelella radicis]
MRRYLVAALWAVIILFPLLASAQELTVGNRVVLHPTSPLGVPLHSESRSSMFGRGIDGAEGEIKETAHGGRWLRVQIDDGPLAWIIKKYIEPARSSMGKPKAMPGEVEAITDVFESPGKCEEAVWSGERLNGNLDQNLRIATWNIRWFPVGDPRRPGKETDLAWLSCALAYIQPDILALQEITATREADVAWAAVTDGLEAFLGGDWRIDLQECGGEHVQHVGFLYNAERVSLSEPFDAWQMNGAAEDDAHPCQNNLRPGRAAYARAIGGGVDFHIVALHSDSGTSARDFDHRQETVERLDNLSEHLRSIQNDSDIIVLGDFNTMGADDRMNAAEEIEFLRRKITGEAPGFRLVEPQLRCSEYFRGACGWLDHIIIAEPMEEAREVQARLSGYCSKLNGAPFGSSEPPAYRQLSDHCPLVVDISAADID